MMRWMLMAEELFSVWTFPSFSSPSSSSTNYSFFPAPATEARSNLSALFIQFPQTDLLVVVFVQHLRRCEIEILLRHVYSPFAQGVHARLGAYTFQFRARAAVHLLGDLGEVDPSREVHGAGVDAEDVGAGFDAADVRKEMLDCVALERKSGKMRIRSEGSVAVKRDIGMDNGMR